MSNKELVRKALETHIESIEKSIEMRGSAVMSKGDLLLMMHQLKDYYPAEAPVVKKELTNKKLTAKVNKKDG